MHDSSYAHMETMVRKHCPNLLNPGINATVADVGGRNVRGEGTYRNIFSKNDQCEYFGIDLKKADGVDIIMSDPHKIPCADQTFDLTISGQTFEHCEFFWMLFLEMVRITKDNGIIIIIAPSEGKEHRYPLDCWRFYNDGFITLGKWGSVKVLETFTDKNGSNKWKDQVGVYQRPKWWSKSLALGNIGLSET